MRKILKIDMVAIANEILDTFHYQFSGGYFCILDKDYEDYVEMIHDMANDTIEEPNYYLREEDLEQIEDDMALYINRALYNRLQLHLSKLESEDALTLLSNYKQYFLYKEEE